MFHPEVKSTTYLTDDQLDVYYPKIDSSVKAPILLLAYGGGFNSGERVFDPPYDLAHRNIGAFYAKRG